MRTLSLFRPPTLPFSATISVSSIFGSRRDYVLILIITVFQLVAIIQHANFPSVTAQRFPRTRLLTPVRDNGTGKTELRLEDDIHVCSVYDSADYCTIVYVNVNGRARPEAGGGGSAAKYCHCPERYNCPNDPRKTALQEKCFFVEERSDWMCFMNCVPDTPNPPFPADFQRRRRRQRIPL